MVFRSENSLHGKSVRAASLKPLSANHSNTVLFYPERGDDLGILILILYCD
jgi:hypothetical protein